LLYVPERFVPVYLSVNLTTLLLNNNQLNSIPDELTDLYKLEVLQLDHNQLKYVHWLRRKTGSCVGITNSGRWDKCSGSGATKTIV
jgi:hypothetical protein